MSWLSAFLPISSLCGQVPADSSSGTIHSNVRLVQIDVIAKDKHGSPVSNLEARDFALLDDGVAQRISRVSVERSTESDIAKAAAVGPEQPNSPIFSNTHPNNVVPTVILFDVLNTSKEGQPSMKNGLLQSLNHMRDGTPLALLILGDDLTVVSDVTTSTISLTKAVGAGFAQRIEGFGPAITAGKTGNSTRDRTILKAATKAFADENRERIVRTLAALNVICEQLGRMRGRKSLVWISGGVSTTEGLREVEDTIDKLNDANITVYAVDVRGVLLDPGLSAETDTNDLTLPLQVDREEARGDLLSVFALETGGVIYRNTNRPDDAITQAMADRCLVYVLDYYPQHSDWSGKLHKIQVKTSHPGVRLRYRGSYRAYLPTKPNAQERQQMLATLASSPLDYAGIHFNVQVEASRVPDSRFVLQLPADTLEWSSEEGKMMSAVQVWFIQKRASGDDLTTKTANANFRLSRDAYQAALSKGLAVATDLKLDASAAKVRVIVRDENSGKIGTVDVPVDALKLQSR